MKIAVSNIALPSYNHINELYDLREMGFRGLEVAPSKVWNEVNDVTPKQVSTYRKQVEKSMISHGYCRLSKLYVSISLLVTSASACIILAEPLNAC